MEKRHLDVFSLVSRCWVVAFAGSCMVVETQGVLLVVGESCSCRAVEIDVAVGRLGWVIGVWVASLQGGIALVVS